MRSFIAMRGRPCFFFLFSKTKTSSVGGSAFRFPIRSLFSRTCSPEVVMALPQQQYTMIIHKTKTDSCCWYSSAIHQSLLLGHTPKRFFGDEASRSSEEKDLGEVLKEAGISLAVRNKLVKEGVSLLQLKEGAFSDDDFSKLGIRLGPRKRLLAMNTKSEGGPKTDLQIEKLLKVLPTVKHSSSSDSLGVVCPEGMKDIGAGVWMMPPPSHDPDFQWLYLEEKGVPLFVRECVRTLCDEILLPSLASGKKKGFVVTGTPGIGKSVLTNWLVACSLSLFPDRPIILHDWQNPKFMRLITKDGSVRVIDDDWFVMNDKKLVYLADTGGRQPRDQLIHAGFAVVTASPAAAPKEFLKHSTSVRTLLPPWTQEECEAVFRAIQAMEPPPERYFPSRDEFERRFKFAGGIPRCLFGPQELSDRYEEGVNNAISNLDSTQRMDANFDMRDVIHKLLHIHPKDPQEAEAGKKWDFIHLSYDFPTEDVQERISTKIQELNKIDAQRSLAWFLGSGLKFPSMRILVGNYFKKCAHDIISSSNDSSSKKHTIQQLLDTTTSTAATTTTTSVQFLVSKKDFCSSFLESDLEEGVYYQPTSSNHPVADSWLVQTEEEENGGCGQKIVVYLFQMTVQSSGHPLKGKKLTSFVKHCLSKFSPTGGRCIIRLVFVIPTQQTRHYERLQQATAGSSPLPSEVEQWKMEIYLPELNGKSFP